MRGIPCVSWQPKKMSFSNAGAGRRPPTGARPMSRAAVPPAVQERMGTGMRPGSRAMGGGAQGTLGSHIRVADRPVTQHGVAGMKTGMKGPQRQVQDKTFYLGRLRSKIQELNAEVARMSKDLDLQDQQNATYLTYEKKAQTLADEIAELRKKLADYNILMDKVNTNTDLEEVQAEASALARRNDLEAQKIDTLFTERTERESGIRDLMGEIEKQEQAAEDIISEMDEATKKRYTSLKEETISLKAALEAKEKELEQLAARTRELEEEVAQSEIKQEAVRLHKELAAALSKRDQWRQKDQETPQQEKERLLRQVKEDNQEIASLERKTQELHDRLDKLHDELHQLEADLEEHQSERSVKYKELKKKEEGIREFLEGFDASFAAEEDRRQQLERAVVQEMAAISQTLVQSKHMPSPAQLKDLKDDLAFKESEMHKADTTARSLELDNTKLQRDLANVEKLEEKTTAELASLKEKIAHMEADMEVFSDLAALERQEEERRELLVTEKTMLLSKKDALHQRMQELNRSYEAAKTQLASNDTFTQLGNLERKWQHLEQNNFVLKEFIANRQAEGNYQQTAEAVKESLADYNTLLCQTLTSPPSGLVH